MRLSVREYSNELQLNYYGNYLELHLGVFFKPGRRLEPLATYQPEPGSKGLVETVFELLGPLAPEFINILEETHAHARIIWHGFANQRVQRAVSPTSIT